MIEHIIKIFFLGGNDKIDECNVVIYNGKYIYFITEYHPKVSRCLNGEVSKDFNKSSD